MLSVARTAQRTTRTAAARARMGDGVLAAMSFALGLRTSSVEGAGTVTSPLASANADHNSLDQLVKASAQGHSNLRAAATGCALQKGSAAATAATLAAHAVSFAPGGL